MSSDAGQLIGINRMQITKQAVAILPLLSRKNKKCALDILKKDSQKQNS